MRQNGNAVVIATLGFNPRICKRCDVELQRQKQALRVSIHASVKDATTNVILYSYITRVSIHASVKDATALIICS